ncbi:ABC transporter ATP-binding protein [Nonomuraea sp. NPDC046570]|uniref:ABC transporter ATP-binding protein n=1 Tax=Nonomuraea sp. NPDC046570 TaxID=3155255 RepID=UPI0033F22318
MSAAPGTRLRRPLRRLASAVTLAWTAHPVAGAGVVGIAVAMGIAPVALAWCTKLLLDDLTVPGEGPALWALGGILLVTCLSATAQSAGRYMYAELRRGVEIKVHSELFTAVNRFPGLALFERPAFRDRLELAGQAGQAAPSQIVQGGAGIAQATVTAGGFLVSLAVLDPWLLVVFCVAACCTLSAELRLGRQRAGMLWKMSPARRHALNYSMLQTDLQAAKEIRLFGLADFLHGRMTGLLRIVGQGERAHDRKEFRVQAALALGGVLVVAASLTLVVLSALDGRLGVGDVAVALAAVAGAQSGLSTLVRQIADLSHVLLVFDHYHDIVNESRRQLAPGGEAPPLSSGVGLRDVWFRYDDEHPWVLKGVDLDIPSGSTIALVGLNGAGKTSLVKLLCRLYDPQQGSVLWNGQDARELSHASLRERMSVVFQDYMAWDLTAQENIGVGRVENLDLPHLIRRAAERAGVHETIEGLPDGYQTMLSRMFSIGDDEAAGVSLSGGQWQRVAVARALLRDDSDLLILDEPSSGLDAEAEYQLQRGLREIRRGRTTLIISHRLSTVRFADEIVVLREGRILERGSHTELMRREGGYAELFRLQAEGYQPEVASR